MFLREIKKDLKLIKGSVNRLAELIQENTNNIEEIQEIFDKQEEVDLIPNGLIVDNLDLPWKIKGNAILDKDGKTVAVDVLIERAEAIISILNSFVE